MHNPIEELVTLFENKAIDRRGFIQSLMLLAVSPTIAQAQAGQLDANSLNHVTLAVSDPERSREFYASVLNMSVVSRQPASPVVGAGINMGAGDSFLGLYPLKNPGRIDHFCIGVDNYVIEEAAEKLKLAGVTPVIREDRPELYFKDPDGITVQLSQKEYRG
jgi:catechol 2,3-dioxygenase-like lactoylglutathione lyase family enzyme